MTPDQVRAATPNADLPVVASQQDFNALPEGTRYRKQNGQIASKPYSKPNELLQRMVANSAASSAGPGVYANPVPPPNAAVPQVEVLNELRRMMANSAASSAGPGVYQNPYQPPAPVGYGLREDGTPKGEGFFGPLRRPDGRVSTEITIGVDIGGRENVQIPTLVPTLTPGEISTLLALRDDQQVPIGIRRKAEAFAEKRIAAGLSPFAGPNESVSFPTNPPAFLSRQLSDEDFIRRVIATSPNPQVATSPWAAERPPGGYIAPPINLLTLPRR
jgi:hypothetical protein